MSEIAILACAIVVTSPGFALGVYIAYRVLR